MIDNLKDILSNLNPDIDQETLLQYLQGHLPAEKQHELEAQLLDSDFETDALEGLETFENKQQLSSLVERLNKDLRKQTQKKKDLQRKRYIQISFITVIAIVLILLLVIISYFIIHRQVHPTR